MLNINSCINQVRFNKETYVPHEVSEVQINDSDVKNVSASKKEDTTKKTLNESTFVKLDERVVSQQGKEAQIDDEKKKTIFDGFYENGEQEKEFDINDVIGQITERKVNIPLFESNPIKTYTSTKDDFPYNARIQSIQSKKCHKCFYPLLSYGIYTNKFA